MSKNKTNELTSLAEKETEKKTEKETEKEAEKEDQQKLIENSSKMDEVIQLLLDREDRNTAESKAKDMYARVNKNEKGSRFHPFKGKRLPVSAHTSNLMSLIEALELQIKTNGHQKDLPNALQGLMTERIAILERVLNRNQKT